MPSLLTIPGQFLSLVERFPSKSALMEFQENKWVSESFCEWEQRSRAVASALIADDISVQDSISVFSYSRREWLEADMGILMCGARTATIYQNIAGETVHRILKDAEVKVVFAEGPVQLRAIFGQEGNAPLPPSLKRIVYFQSSQQPPSRAGKPAPSMLTLAETVPIDKKAMLVSFEDYIKKGQELLGQNQPELESRLRNLSEEDIAKVVYTSGTTGVPKGAMLTHKNLTSVTAHLEETIRLKPSDKTLLFLPLAHVYAQLVYHAQMRYGFTIAFARSLLTAVEDAESMHPDFFVSVPRLFEKIYAGVLEQVEQGGTLKKKIFNWATDVGAKVSRLMQANESLPMGLAIQASLAHRLVFSKLQSKLGGKVRMMISGGAPLQKEIIEFFHAAGLLIIEGYGMTENASLSHHNHLDNYRFGTVGLPLKETEMLIADDGEILVRSPGVMKGYLNLPKETAESIDAGGWLHTGDIGEVDSDGFLKITDRKKDIIVTSGGKNIAPSPIEAHLTRLKYVSQALVFGNRRKFLTALITLDRDASKQWAEANGLADADMEALSQNPQLRKLIEAEIIGMNRHLEQYETIKRFAIAPREFTIADGEITPSLKLRKKIIEEHYGYLVEELYKN
ncbi:MAG: long-chain fatty acid--CoA ligase [Deltaproteobacteria bacterium]|nr:long-chain fatty acid--CoA ligase [Deltaproteobacteria bacterium]